MDHKKAHFRYFVRVLVQVLRHADDVNNMVHSMTLLTSLE